jgi:hypothetical protein
MNTNKNFVGSRMNKSLDERLIRPGEYTDALNIRISSDEDGEAGSVENAKGNEKIVSLTYNGSPLTNAKCIGAYEDGANETIYWFVTSDEADMICSYNTKTRVLKYHVVSNVVLNFGEYMTGIDLVDDMLFFTDNVNPPRRININHSYPQNAITEDDISVIVKPPVESPSIELITQPVKNNYIEDKFIRFAYRYKYKNGEYSALSQFSELAFEPSEFNFDYGSFDMTGMRNSANAANVTFNTGSKNVVGIDLCFKQSNSNIINVIEKFDKKDEGWADNQSVTIKFDNQKIYTTLPASELLRTFDNVPRLAKAQTVMGNRIVYGNYLEGYNIENKVSFKAELYDEEIGYTQIEPTIEEGTEYTIDVSKTISDSRINIDLTGVELKKGSSIFINFNVRSESFSGDASYSGAPNNFEYTYQFVLPKDYGSISDLVADSDFLSTIQHDYSSGTSLEEGYSLTSQFFKSIVPDSGWDKQTVGITGDDQSVLVTLVTGSSQYISLQFPAVKYFDGSSLYAYEYFNNSKTTASFLEIGSRESLHSNRDYEVGIVYMDEYGRSTTAITDTENTVYIPPQNSKYKNNIQVTIDSTPPSWAERYKFVLKPSKTDYETVYSSVYFQEINDSAYWVKLDGDNQTKLKVGDNIIVKLSDSGATNKVIKTKVLDLELKEADFLTDILTPSGYYMKIKPSNFSVDKANDDIIDLGSKTAVSNRTRVDLLYPTFTTDDQGVHSEYEIPAGSQVKIFFENSRDGKGSAAGSRYYIFDKKFIATKDYNNFYDFIIGENIDFTDPTNFPSVESSDDTTPTAEFITSIGNEDDFVNFPETNFPDITNPSHTEGVTKLRYFRHTDDGSSNVGKAWLGIASAGRRADGKNYVTTAHIEVIRSGSLLAFETEPLDNPTEIYYEGSKSYPIVNGYHTGSVQDQTIIEPCISTVDIFDCFAFGNGVESFKIDDAFTGVPFRPGERVTSVSEQDYKETRRFADLTYSGVYNQETNVNKLNEFNLGLANFKTLEQSFGPIQKITARQTDILVLQEDKISYVLAGKNLLTDAGAGEAILNSPEVLGTQIARSEDYGISNDNESFAKYGNDIFFTDSKRGSVINIQGSGNIKTDKLLVVSDAGMRSYFRNTLSENMSKIKLGAFDPYSREYVLTVTDETKPSDIPVVEAGTEVCMQSATETIEYNVLTTSGIGEAGITYDITGGQIRIEVTYNGTTALDITRTGSTTETFDKTSYSVNSYHVKITPSGEPDFCVTFGDVELDELTIIPVVRNSNENTGETIHVEYSWRNIDHQSPVYKKLVSLKSSGVSLYETITGNESVGLIPADGSTILMRLRKESGDTYNFDGDRFKKLYSNTLYTEGQVDTLVQELSLSGTIVETSAGVFDSEFSYTNILGYQYLYLVWDLAEPAVNCGTASVISESRGGYFEVIVDLKDRVGDTTFTFNSGNEPARFQVEYDGQIVGDTLWFDDQMTQNDIDLILLKNYTLSKFVYTASGFEDTTTSVNVGNYSLSDIDQTPKTQASIVFNKPSSSPRYAKIIVHRIASDDTWTIGSIGCPILSGTTQPESSYSFSSGTYLYVDNTLPLGENPKTETITGTITVTGLDINVSVTASKSFNYANTAVGTFSISGGSSVGITAGASTPSATSASMVLSPGTYTYTLTGELTINSPLTYGMMTATLNVS